MHSITILIIIYIYSSFVVVPASTFLWKKSPETTGTNEDGAKLTLKDFKDCLQVLDPAEK